MRREASVLRSRNRELVLDHTVIMGVVNVTPDSFSDGGRFYDPDAAVEHALRLVEEGAEIVDIGGESSRPGSDPVSAEEEWRRVEPVLRGLCRKTYALISIDTYKPEVAAKALAAGADMVNDITGLRDERMIALAAEASVPAVIMHMKGEPKSMQDDPVYEDVIGEIRAFLRDRAHAAVVAGLSPHQIIVDPGIGFGKKLEHNIEILRRLREFRGLGFPILVGASRKSFLGMLTGQDVSGRLEASVAAAVLAAERGADIVRVHDVAATAKALKVADALVRV